MAMQPAIRNILEAESHKRTSRHYTGTPPLQYDKRP
jgi:hypothetical protein